MKRPRRRAARRVMLLLALLVAAGFADSALRVVTTEYTVVSARLPAEFDGFRVVQLSDVHGKEFGEGNKTLLARVAAAEPDLIALTGDLASGAEDLPAVERLLAGLTAIAPVYYVSGNHEWAAGILPALSALFEAHGVRWLRNESLTLTRGGAEIVLAGVDDPNGPRDQLTPDALCDRIAAEKPGDFVLLLAHRNDFREKYPDLAADAGLCGHAHGGVVRLPFVGGLLGTGRELFPADTAGALPSGRYTLIVSRGIGDALVPRFCNNPEIVVAVLRRAE